MPTDPRHRILFIDRDAEQAWLTAVEVGHVVDGLDPERVEHFNDHAAWLLDEAGGRAIGVLVSDTVELDPTGEDWGPCWDADGPRFDAPSLALSSALAGEVIVAALATYKHESTLNRAFYLQALGATDAEALSLWKLCLECGDLTAHYALGYTHYELGQFGESYSHLRYYATLATHDPWIWCWLGKAALAVGEREEAIKAWCRARLLEGDEHVTDASDLLAGVLRGAQW